MKILVINSWSSSIKFKVFDMTKKIELTSWLIEEIWSKNSLLKYNNKDKDIESKINFKTHKDWFKKIIQILQEQKILPQIKAIWHRAVHWWEYFHKPTVINKNNIKKLKEISYLAPLHNPKNIEWIEILQDILPKTKQIAVFDTWFYHNMKIENFLYPIPLRYYQKDQIRKYWFHWISHDYISHKSCKLLWLQYNKQKIISCHIWNWTSITAINKWNIIDTSMWMTPLDWLMMWTRSGSIDPSIIQVLYQKEKKDFEQINNILNKESWLLWISQKSNDMREILKWIKQWDQNCKIAYTMFINRIIKYISGYVWLMWWVDLLVLAGWIMENNSKVRSDVLKRLAFLWIQIDWKQNKTIWKDIEISSKNSKTKVYVIKTKEEYMIAKHSYKLIKN